MYICRIGETEVHEYVVLRAGRPECDRAGLEIVTAYTLDVVDDLQHIQCIYYLTC
jgi:hypothetical protein